MKIRIRDFETNQASTSTITIKNYNDLRIDPVKKYGLLNLWKWWREESGGYTLLMEMSVIK